MWISLVIVALTGVLGLLGVRCHRLRRENRVLTLRLEEYLSSEPVRLLGQALADVEEQRARGDRMLGFVQDIEKERDRWRTINEEGMRGAGAAQALLMGELDRIFKKAARLAAQLRKAGVKVPPLALRAELRPILEEHGLSTVEPASPPPAALLPTP